jgi:hypothetical protein
MCFERDTYTAGCSLFFFLDERMSREEREKRKRKKNKEE